MNIHEWEGERTREPKDVTCTKNGGSRVRSPSRIWSAGGGGGA